MISFSKVRSASASFHQAATLQRIFMAKRGEAVYDMRDSTRNISKALEISAIAIALWYFSFTQLSSFEIPSLVTHIEVTPPTGAKFHRSFLGTLGRLVKMA
jgi:hypothetical protein